MPEFRIRTLSKDYTNRVTALQNIYVAIYPGLHGLLGPNAASMAGLHAGAHPQKAPPL